MKKLIFISLLFTSISAHAEWEYIGESENGVATFFIDRSTIKKNSGVAKMWSMQNYISVQKQGQHSIKLLNEYDCKNDTNRAIAFLAYSKPMGAGEILFQDYKVDPWTPFTPDSTTARLSKIACR